MLMPNHAYSDDALEPVSALMERWGEPQYNGTRFPALKVTGAGAGEMANVIIPAELKGEKICLSIHAAKDWYTAEQTFQVAEDWKGGIAGTTLASDYDTPPRNIFDVPAGAGLTRFAKGPCDKVGRDLTLLLSAWRELPRGSRTSIYVLAQRGERVAAQLVALGIAVQCAEDAQSSGRYTHRCDFQTDALTQGEHTMEIVVFGVRVVNGEEVETPERRDFLTIYSGRAIEP